MLFGCLVLDSCAGMGHVVEHKYDTLLSSTSDDLTATPWKFGNINDPMSPFPALEKKNDKPPWSDQYFTGAKSHQAFQDDPSTETKSKGIPGT
jgi:hypothetical protein